MQEIWDLIVYNFYGFLIILARMTGIFGFNPIFSRANVPMRVRVMMTMALSVFMLSVKGGVIGYIPASLPAFVAAILMEAAIGLVCGFVVNMILTVLIYAGEMIDNQTGLGMAKAMDPSTGVTMPIFANVYYYLFVLYFFLTGCHRSYIKLFILSYDTIPVGFSFTEQTKGLALTLAQYFGTVLELGLKFAMPIVAVELVVEFLIGVLMKAVPTIQVFVVNIQLKIIVGLLMIVALAGPMSGFIEELLEIMMNNLESVLPTVGA